MPTRSQMLKLRSIAALAAALAGTACTPAGGSSPQSTAQPAPADRAIPARADADAQVVDMAR